MDNFQNCLKQQWGPTPSSLFNFWHFWWRRLQYGQMFHKYRGLGSLHQSIHPASIHKFIIIHSSIHPPTHQTSIHPSIHPSIHTLSTLRMAREDRLGAHEVSIQRRVLHAPEWSEETPLPPQWTISNHWSAPTALDWSAEWSNVVWTALIRHQIYQQCYTQQLIVHVFFCRPTGGF